MMKMAWPLFLLCGLLATGTVLAQSTQPPLHANDWNFVLVPSFESAPAPSNNLSRVGLNHALRFGQLLDTLLAGKRDQLRRVYAFSFERDADNMRPLESIEPFAVLNNLDVKTQWLHAGNASSYNSPGYVVRHILDSQPRGTYIMAMPPAMIRDIAKSLTGTASSVDGRHQYLVIAGREAALAATAYDDGIANVRGFPRVAMPARRACMQKHVVLHVKAPGGWHPYTSETVYLVRHVEAHPNPNFENGNYVCRGQWRALGTTRILRMRMHGRKPDFVFTSNPGNIMDCGNACSYIRPSLTVAPFAIRYDMPLTLARFQWNDAADLAQSLFNRDSPYFRHPSHGSRILVGWEHAHIEKAVKYLLSTMYRDPKAARKVPAWSYQDYDTIWELHTDKAGNITFRNSCEGIRTAALPSTCPSFEP